MNARFSGFSTEEIEVLMDMTSGRVEDMECEEMKPNPLLLSILSELEAEHMMRIGLSISNDTK